MKKLLLLLALISTNASANYFFQRHHVAVQFQFVSYHQRPAMCVYNQIIPRWTQQCGVNVSMVSGCNYGPYGYTCGHRNVSQFICAWHLAYQVVPVVDYCGRRF